MLVQSQGSTSAALPPSRAHGLRPRSKPSKNTQGTYTGPTGVDKKLIPIGIAFRCCRHPCRLIEPANIQLPSYPQTLRSGRCSCVGPYGLPNGPLYRCPYGLPHGRPYGPLRLPYGQPSVWLSARTTVRRTTVWTSLRTSMQTSWRTCVQPYGCPYRLKQLCSETIPLTTNSVPKRFRGRLV